MIFVVVEEHIPESQRSGNTDIATMGTLAGFTVTMMLDVAVGWNGPDYELGVLWSAAILQALIIDVSEKEWQRGRHS